MQRGLSAAGVALVLMVGGCSAVGAPIPSTAPPSPATTAGGDASTLTPSASASAPTSMDVFPSCSELIPLDVVRRAFSESAVLREDGAGTTIADRLPGESAIAAAESAVRTEHCAWILAAGSDGGVHAAVIELTASARDRLMKDLRDAGTFSETTDGDATIFSREYAGDLSDFVAGYVFEGSTWIAVVGNLSLTGLDDEILPGALAALRAVNA